MTFIKIGSGTTNKKGYAIMNKNKQNQKITHSYTGTEAGKTQIIAKIKNTELTTTPTDIYDTIWYDTANKDNTNKWNWNNLEHAIIEEGCLITSTQNSTIYAKKKNNTNLSLSSSQNWILELDIKSIDATLIAIQMFNITFQLPYDTEAFTKIKLEMDTRSLKIYANDTLITTKTISPGVSSTVSLGVRGSIIFKNAKAYKT